MIKDAATLSCVGLVKQVLPSRDSCWLASANGKVVSSSSGEGRTGNTDYCPVQGPAAEAAAVGAASSSPWQQSS